MRTFDSFFKLRPSALSLRGQSMKKTALLAAAAALFAASPAMAQSGGHVGVNYGNTDSGTSDADTWQIDGALGGTSGSLGYQFDAGVGSSDTGSSDVDDYTLAGHLYWAGENWRLGGVVAMSNLDGGSVSVDETVYGVEGSVNFGPSTVVLGSYTVGESELGIDADTWNADIGLNHYFTDNFRLGVTAGTGNIDIGIGDTDTTSLGVSAEWQPWTTPVSFRLSYDTFDIDSNANSLDTLAFGVRWNWGGSLRERDNATPFEIRTGIYQRVYGIQ